MMEFEQHKRYSILRQKELLRMAEQQRLASLTQKQRRVIRFYHPVVASFGRWLVASGQYLQRQYGEFVDVPAPVQQPRKPARRNA